MKHERPPEYQPLDPPEMLEIEELPVELPPPPELPAANAESEGERPVDPFLRRS